MKKMWIYITYLVPVGIFVFLFSKIGIQEVISVLKEMHPGFLVMSIVFSLFGSLIIAVEKWRQILKSLGLYIGFKELFVVHTGSIPVKMISPMKSGMLLRAVYLHKNHDVTLLKGGYSLFLTVFLNFVTVICFIVIASFLLGIDSPQYVYLGVPTVFCCFLLFWFFRGERARRIVKRFFNVWGGKFAASVETHLGSMKIRVHGLAIPFLYAVLLVFLELLNFKVVSCGLGLPIPFLTIVFLASVTILIGNLPVAISGFGTREAAVCFFFSAYGASDKLLSLGITISLVEYLLPVLVGLFLTKFFLVQLTGK